MVKFLNVIQFTNWLIIKVVYYLVLPGDGKLSLHTMRMFLSSMNVKKGRRLNRLGNVGFEIKILNLESAADLLTTKFAIWDLLRSLY